MRDRLLSIVPGSVVFLAVLLVGYPLLRTTPLSWDHPTHLFKAWHMATQMLASFRVRGFSHYWAFGFPSDELVPPGEELWVLLFRLVTLGKLTWVRTYGVALFGLLVLSALSIYRFARQYLGTVAAVITGVFMAWDPGDWAQGGWFWAIRLGVWPVTLGVSCILLALVSLERLLERGTSRQFAFAGFWVAAAFISHQATLVFLPIMVALLLADHWLRRASSSTRLGLVVLACAFGTALSAFYLVPMLARSEQTLDLGVAGTDFDDIGRRIIRLHLFGDSWPGFVVLAFIGAIVGFRRRVPGVFLLCAGSAVFFWLTTDGLVSVFHAERLMPTLRKIEAQRMLCAAKVLWLPLVGYALSLPFEGFGAFLQRLERRPIPTLSKLCTRWAWAPVVGLLLLTPYVRGAFEQFVSTQVKKPEPVENVAFWPDLQSVWAFTAQLRSQSDEHYRIAYDVPDHLSTLAPVFDNTLMFKVGNTPSQCFAFFPHHSDPRLYRLLSVKYVVSDHPLDAPLYALERSFGRLTLYRFNDFDPNPFSVIGDGKAELLEFSPERVRVRLRETTANSRLKLHVAFIDHWRARQGNKTLRIVPATTFGIEDPVLMEVPALDGDIVFEYARRASDWLGLILSLLAVPAFLAGSWLVHARPRFVRLPRISALQRRGLYAFAALGVLTLGAAGVRRYLSRSAMVPQDSLFRELADGQMSVDGAPCKLDGPFEWTCGGRTTVKAQRVLTDYAHVCLTTAGSSLELRTRRHLGEFVSGSYDVRDGPGSVHAWLAGRDLGSTDARPKALGLSIVQFDTRAAKREGEEFRLELRGSVLHCFDFRVVP